jgi:DNA processing protein
MSWMADPEVAARVRLAAAVDPLDGAVNERVGALGSAAAVLEEVVAARSPLRRAAAYAARLNVFDVDAALARTHDAGARILTPESRHWPVMLDDLGPLRPLALWVRGPFDLGAAVNRPSVAMVGARACTHYGEQVAVDFAADLAGRGWVVVSGGAYGIDAAAHRGALAVEGTTIAVLANGIDLTYPRGNDALIARIADVGAVVTELPPGRTPTRAGFLARNRIIAALAGVTVVVEAAARSGSAATVARAVELGRDVCGVPGPITSVTSVGVHALLRDGAVLVTSPADVVELLAPMGDTAQPPAGPAFERDALGPDARAILDALPSRGGLDEAALAVRSGLSVARVLGQVGRLLLEGWIERAADGQYRLAARAKGR